VARIRGKHLRIELLHSRRSSQIGPIPWPARLTIHSHEVVEFMTTELKVLRSFVELLWRQTMYTRFVTMAITNLAKDKEACRELCEVRVR
jgi:hypothetical protein